MSSSSRLAAKWRPVVFGLVAVACFFALDRVAGSTLKWLILHSQDRFAQAYAGGRQDDVLVVGSSVGIAMVVPRDLAAATDMRVFNLSVHGLDAITLKALVQDYLAENAAPRVAVLDMRTARAQRIWAPQLEMYATADNHLGTVTDRYRESRIPWRNVFHIVRFNSDSLAKTMRFVFGGDEQDSAATDGRMTEAVIDGWRRGTTNAAGKPEQIEAFGDALRLLKAAGTEPIVVAAPLYGIAQEQAAKGLAELSSAIPPDGPLCDFSTLLPEPRFFEDPAHLNKAGRAAFLPVLAETVEQAVAGTLDSDCGAVRTAAR